MDTKYTIARISLAGERFEILVHPEKALQYRMGKKGSLSDILAIDVVYTDAGKGLRASEASLKKAFGTTDVEKIADVILTKGELQLTAEQRRRLIEDKRKQIVAFISRHCIDPRTGLPHPPARIEQAMAQAKFSIDPFKDAEEQAKEVIQALRSVLPIRMEVVKIAVRIPPAHAARCMGVLKEFGSISQQEWGSDGSLTATLEVPAGLQAALVERLGKITKGEAQVKVLK